MSRLLRGSARGWRMPAEWEPQAACWLLWPERPDVWRDEARPAQAAFAAVAAAISRFQPVTVGASASQFATARDKLPPAVRVVELSADDAWMRDVGPTFVTDPGGAMRGIHWRFNAWGGLYAAYERDREVGVKVCELIGIDRYAPALICEGGAIHTDGAGTLLATEECVLAANRNKGRGRAWHEAFFRRFLGIRRTIWLGRGVPNDETGGHVDNLCCFVRPGEVALAWTDDDRDPLFVVCRDAAERLRAARDARGRRLRVHPLPQPKALLMSPGEAAGIVHRRGTKRRRAGDRLAASYINYFLATGALIMPLFDTSADRLARRRLKALFPDRAIVGVPAREIVLGGGGIHCITLGQPRPHG